MEHPLPALIVFGILLAITLFGLFRSNSASNRNNASTEDRDHYSDTYSPTVRSRA